jgi:molecular chaperone GrpE (heat shock protein)
MRLDKKILEEIQRYRSINNYISEQEAIDALTAPLPGDDVAPALGAEATPPTPPTPEPIDIESDPDVEKIDDEGNSEENTDETSGSEELDITELVDAQKSIQTKQDDYFENLFGQLSNLEQKLGEMDTIMNKLNSLENKIEKYREKTPQEKLELRSYDSYPFNQKLSQFFDDKQEEMEKTGKNDYILTADDVTDINVNDIKNSFQGIGFKDEYKYK